MNQRVDTHRSYLTRIFFFLVLGVFSDLDDKKKDTNGRPSSIGSGNATENSSSGNVAPTDVAHPKPRIWSLADMATSGSLSGGGSTGSLSGGVGGKIIGGGLTRGLHHLEGTPYTRPLFAHSSYPYIPGAVPESLLSYSYGKSFGGFPPVSLADVPPGLLASAPFVHELARHDLPRPEISKPEVIRPEPRQILDKDV